MERPLELQTRDFNEGESIPLHVARTVELGNSCRGLWLGDDNDHQRFHPLEALLLVNVLDGFAKTDSDRNVALVMALSNLVAFPVVHPKGAVKVTLMAGPMQSKTNVYQCSVVDQHPFCVQVSYDLEVERHYRDCREGNCYQCALCPGPMRHVSRHKSILFLRTLYGYCDAASVDDDAGLCGAAAGGWVDLVARAIDSCRSTESVTVSFHYDLCTHALYSGNLTLIKFLHDSGMNVFRGLNQPWCAIMGCDSPATHQQGEAVALAGGARLPYEQ